MKRCKNCGNVLNEWQNECELCKTETREVCKCHGEIVKRVKGAYLGQYDNECSINGMYCETVLI